MINTLKTVKEFKDTLKQNDSCIWNYEYLCNYIDLLEQPLKLGYFVPCDENDKPYDKEVVMTTCTEIYNEYWIAEERVLFAGFEYNEECPKLSIYDKENDLYFSFGKDSYTISDLVYDSFFTKGNRKYKLTDNFKKLITG